MNAELAFNFEKACQELGLTTSEAFTIFATKVARERRIPFEVAVDPFYSKRNIARLKKSIAQMEAIGAAVGEVDVHD
jgi:DNA-damage-inducible protein J